MRETRLAMVFTLACAPFLLTCQPPPRFSAIGRTVPRPGLCRVTATEVASTGAPPVLGSPTHSGVPLSLCKDNMANGVPEGTACSCEDYHGAYPVPPEMLMSIEPPFSGGVDDDIQTGVFDTTVTRYCHNQGDLNHDCVSGGKIEGCAHSTIYGEVIYAWPDCAAIGQVSGTVFEHGQFSASGFLSGNDNVCPEALSVLMPNNVWMAKDLRELRNFYGKGDLPADQPVGRIHVEVQGCRYYRGVYQILDPGSNFARDYQARPEPGDLITAAGDWVFDVFHEDEDGPASGWNEIHEARIIANAKRAPLPADGTVSFLFVSTLFAVDNQQEDVLEIQAKVGRPLVDPPANMKWAVTSCEIDPKFPGVVKRPFCSAYPLGDVTVTPRDDLGACQITVLREPDLTSVGRVRHDNTCQVSCDGNDFSEPGSCNQLGYAGVVKATWTAVPDTAMAPPPPQPDDQPSPGDLWMCNNCACGDPASASPIMAPVIGCVATGLDPASPGAQQAACEQACGGLICPAGQPCLTKTCSRPPAGAVPSARVVGRNSCVPGVPGDPYRMTSVAQYHVTLTPRNPSTGQGSFATFTVGDSVASNVPLHGEVSFNMLANFDPRSGSRLPILDLANLELTPDDFNVGKQVTNAKVFIAQRLWAKFFQSTTFVFPARSVVLGVRGLVDGDPSGANEENVTDSTGTFDPVTRAFTLDVSGEDIGQDNQRRTIAAHLVGTVDNLPPTAVITGASTPLECGTAQTLSAASSTDPDGTIARYQWLIDGAQAGTQNQLAVLSRKLGRTDYDLRVYDASLAASHAKVAINVVDTIAPNLIVPPNVTTHICQTSGTIAVGQATATDACATPTVSGAAVSLNNVSLVTPIPVVNGQIPLGIGTYRIQWTASDGTNTRVGFQTVVVGTGIEASQSYVLNDRAAVRAVGGTPAAVLNAGTGQTRIGNDGVSGNIVSVGPVTVLDRAVVGSITSASSSVTVSSTATAGPITRNAQVTLPPLPALPTFPTASQPGFTLNAGQSRTLSPGSYGGVTLNSQSTLVLQGGDYFFTTFTMVNSAVTLRAVSTTRVFVKTTLAFRSPFTNSGGQIQAVTLGFAGTSTVLEAAFNGTLIAPNGTVSFGISSGLTFTGMFFAKGFDIRPASTLVCQ